MSPIDPAEADAIARSINAGNRRATTSAERMAHVVLAVVLGLLGAAALVHWGVPCDAGALCMAPAVVTPTRTSLWSLLCGRLHSCWLRHRIGTAMADLNDLYEMEAIALAELQAIPVAKDNLRDFIRAQHEQIMAIDRRCGRA